MKRCFSFLGARLHRRIFLWFGATILLAVVCSMLIFGWVFRTEWGQKKERLSEFVSEQFSPVWDDPTARELLLYSVADTFDSRIELRDASGRKLASAGGPCLVAPHRATPHQVPVKRNETVIGYVAYCGPRRPHPTGLGLLMLLFFGAVLWLSSLAVARRISRPLSALAEVTRRIGHGDLTARAALKPPSRDEVSELAASINDMASRIEKQMRDQRELLAAVSHEIRTPLGHLRVLAELLERDGVSAQRKQQLQRELYTIDRLVAELLANSRLEFGALDIRTLNAAEFTRDLLQRGTLPAERDGESRLLSAMFVDETANCSFKADPTLVSQALCNLLDNARKHGGGIERVETRIEQAAERSYLVFSVTDHGPGVQADEAEQIFDAFFRGRIAAEGSSLGLGLALVRKIAEAHGGRAWAVANDGSGASVCFSVLLP